MCKNLVEIGNKQRLQYECKRVVVFYCHTRYHALIVMFEDSLILTFEDSLILMFERSTEVSLISERGCTPPCTKEGRFYDARTFTK